MKLKMGTRGSPLALAQSGAFVRELCRLDPGLEVETVKITTSGDRFSIQTPQAAQKLMSEGTKGLFVKEIEEALLAGSVDFAVHSAKDLPGELAPGLVIGAYPEREDPRDAYIGRGSARWADLKAGQTVGTASLRRSVQLQKAKPGVLTAPMRGNVDTRLRKLADGACDGLVMAVAGLKRLGRTDVPFEPIPVEVMLPAPAQGTLAVETKTGRKDVLEVLSRIDHAATRSEAECERAFLAAIGGGCSTPLGALARHEPGGLKFTVFWSDPLGKAPVRLERSLAAGSDPRPVAKELACLLLGS